MINSQRSAGHRVNGSIYPGQGNDVFPGFGLPPVASNSWFKLEIVAQGNVLCTRVDGQPAGYFVDAKQSFSRGRIVLEQHGSNKSIEFRNFEFRKLDSWDQKDPREIARLVGHEFRIGRAAFSADGRTILTGGNGHVRVVADNDGRGYHHSYDNTVRLWDAETGQNLAVMKEHDWEVVSLATSSNGRLAVSASGWTVRYSRKIVAVWDLESGRRLHLFSQTDPEKDKETFNGPWITAASFTSDDRRVMAAYTDGIVRTWDLEKNGQQSRVSFEGGGFRQDEFANSAFAPDKTKLLTSNGAGVLELWEVKTGKRVGAFRGHRGKVRGLAFSSDGQLILSGGNEDGTVRLWNTAAGKQIQVLDCKGDGLRCVAISPDGRHALTAGHYGVIRFWELATGKELIRIAGHNLGVNSVAFSPDGQRAVSVSDDKTGRVWQLPRLEAEGVRKGRQAAVAGDLGRQSGFVPIFNGKDLAGWKDVLANGSEWKVVDGLLEGRGAGEAGPANLVTHRRNFTNYRLRTKFRYQQGGGSLVEVRFSGSGDNRSGYLVNLNSWPRTDQWQIPAGSTTKMRNQRFHHIAWDLRAEPTPVPVNSWNTAEITAIRDRVTTSINGKTVADHRDASGWYGSGAISLLVLGKTVIQFQEILIEELPD